MNEYIVDGDDMFDIYNRIVADSDTVSFTVRGGSLGSFFYVKSKKDLVDFTAMSGADYIRKINEGEA